MSNFKLVAVFLILLFSHSSFAETSNEKRQVDIAGSLQGAADEFYKSIKISEDAVSKIVNRLDEEIIMYESSDSLKSYLSEAKKIASEPLKKSFISSKATVGLVNTAKVAGTGMNIYNLYDAIDKCFQDYSKDTFELSDSLLPVLEKAASFSPWAAVAVGFLDNTRDVLEAANGINDEYSRSLSTIVNQYYQQYNTLSRLALEGASNDSVVGRLDYFEQQRIDLLTQLFSLKRDINGVILGFTHKDELLVLVDSSINMFASADIRKKQVTFYNRFKQVYDAKLVISQTSRDINAVVELHKIKIKELQAVIQSLKDQSDNTLPTLPAPQSTPAASISLVPSSQEITAGPNDFVSFNAFTSAITGSVFITIKVNGVQERLVEMVSTNKRDWATEILFFNTAGIRTVSASIRDASGIVVTEGPAITLTVKPSATVTNVIASVGTVVLGGNVEFTASVQGEVASGAQVILKLDSYETPMERSGNVWKKMVEISDLNPNDNRTYTAYVKDNGISGESPPAKTLEVTSPVKIDSVEAKMHDQLISSCAMYDKVDFYAKISGGVVPDKVFLKLDSYTLQMTQQSPGLWRVQVSIDQTNGGIRTYSVYTEKSRLKSNYATPKNLTVKLSNATLAVEAQDINGNRVSTVNLNDHVHFVVNIDGEANGPVKVKVGSWTIPQALVRQGSSKKWKTVESVPMQEVETKTYYAFVDVNRQEAAKSLAGQVVVSRADGLQCPATAKTGDFINAELLVDNSKTIVKITSKIKATSCSGGVNEAKLQFEKAGYGWVWPGTRVNGDLCGTLEFIADTKTGSSIHTYRCTTRVNMGSESGQSAPPIPAPAPQPQSQGVIESSSSSQALGDGFTLWKVTVTKQPEGKLNVKMNFYEGGILTESIDYTNRPINILLQQNGNEWSKKIKNPGQHAVPYRMEFWLNNHLVTVTPGVFSPSVQEYTLTPADVRVSKTRINESFWEITVDLLKEPPQPPNPDLYVSIIFPEGHNFSYGAGATELGMAEKTAGKSWHFIAQPGLQNMPFSVRFQQMGGKQLMTTATDVLPVDSAQNETVVKALYQSFASFYNSKNDSRLRSLISDDWESDGDGTTLSDLEMNLRSSFRIFDQIGCTISNLKITRKESDKYIASYDITIKGAIFRNNIRHEEKSTVIEEVVVDSSGKAKITKTLNGRFWYVQ